MRAGSPHYLGPGHAVVLEAGSEVVEFSPSGPFAKTMEVVGKYFEAMQGQPAGET